MHIVNMWWFFIQIVSMWWFFKHSVSMRWFFIQLVSMRWFFIHIVSVKIIFSMKRGYVYVWGTCKNVWVLRVCFLKSKSIQATKWPRTVYLQLLILEIMTLRYLKTLVFDKVFKKIWCYIIWCFHFWRVLLVIINPLFMVIQLHPPYTLNSQFISGKLTLPQKILEVSSDSPLLFRGEKDTMQVRYIIQVATDFDQ